MSDYAIAFEAAPDHLIEAGDDTFAGCAPPARRLADAARVDRELLEHLPRMLADDETITVRAVVRRMLTTGQPSTLTRDAWRMARVAEYQARQRVLRAPVATAAPEIPAIQAPRFHELRCFASVARAGCIGRAARDLNIGQPTLTNQIRRLEAGLGTQLLLRHVDGVSLTGAGSRLLGRLDAILDLLAPPLEAAPGAAPAASTLSLALSPEVGQLLAPKLAAQAHTRWPQIMLDIRVGTGATLAEWVLHHQADIAVVQDPPPLPGLRIDTVVTERLGLVMAPCSPLARESRLLRFRDLAELTLILPSQQHALRRRLDLAAFQHRVRLEPVLQVDSATLAKAMVRNDLGYSILPAMAVQEELARGTLVFRPIGRPALATHHAVVTRQLTPSPVVVAFADILRDTMTEFVERGAWSGARTVRTKANPGPGEIESVATENGQASTQ